MVHCLGRFPKRTSAEELPKCFHSTDFLKVTISCKSDCSSSCYQMKKIPQIYNLHRFYCRKLQLFSGARNLVALQV